MRVTLVYVGIFEGNNVVPPLGVMYIAAVLEKAGYRVQVLDVDPLNETCIDSIKEFNPHMIGVGFLTSAYGRARTFIAQLREQMPDAKLFCGGVHTTAEPVDVLTRFGVDFVVVGEGEYATLDACDRIRDGRTLEGVKGVMYRNGAEIVDNGARELVAHLDELPLPARHLVDYGRRYCTFPGVIRGRWVRSTILTIGRGCPFSCSYCAVQTIFGRTCRLRSIGSVIDELNMLKREYGIRGFFFNDSIFTINKKWVMEFCGRLIAEKMDLVWGCNSRVDTVSEEMLVAMRKAGCIRVDFGVESGSDMVLRSLNKGVTVRKIKDAFAASKKAGLKCGASFMIGSPGETRADVERTLQLAKEIAADYTVFFYTTPFPGTELYRLAQENGWIDKAPSFSEAWAFRESDTPVMQGAMTTEELRTLRARLQNAFFIRNYIHWYNVRIMLTLLGIALVNPALVVHVLLKIPRVKRIDTLAEMFLTAYRFKMITGRSLRARTLS